jgi:hypothetical protein
MVAIQGVFNVDDMEDTIFQNLLRPTTGRTIPDRDAAISIE